jgi:hypothetical protein
MINAVVVVLGLIAVVVGVALIYIPAGVIVAGAGLIALAYLEAPRRETSRRPGP